MAQVPNPAETGIADPLVWLDSDVGVWTGTGDIPAVIGDSVYAWENRGTWLDFFRQTTSAKQPILAAGPNGHNEVHFDGVDDWMNQVQGWNVPCTLFMVYRTISWTDQKSPFGTPDDASYRFNGLFNAAAPPPYYTQVIDVGWTTNTKNGTMQLDSYNTYICRYPHGANVITQYDGKAAVSQAHSVPSGTRLGFNIAARGSGGGAANIGVACVLLYGYDMTDAEVQAVIDYLGDRYYPEIIAEDDIRAYNADGKRIALPDAASMEFELLERGGYGAGSLRRLETWQSSGFVGGERIDVRLFGEFVYRGWVRMPQSDIDSPERLTLTTYGLMEALNHYIVLKKYVYGQPTDIATVFSDIVADYVGIAARYPSIVTDAQATSVLIQELDARGKTVAAAFNALCDVSPQLAIWGHDVNTSFADRLYLRPRATAVSKRYVVGGDVEAFEYPQNLAQIVNRIYITGGDVGQPNLLLNPSFEDPAPNSETIGNLILDYSFETGTGWTLSGGATIQDSGSGLVEGASARTGVKLLELDQAAEEASVTINADYTVPYVASCYARRESAGTACDIKITVDGLDSGGTPVAGATVSTSYADPGGSVWKQYSLLVDFSAYATVAKLKVRYITSQGSEAATGTLVDDCGLWESGAVAQPKWSWDVTGAAKRVTLDWVHDAIAPYHGGYCVKMQASAIALTADTLEIWTNKTGHVPVKASQLYTLAVFVRGDGTNDVSFSIGMTQYKSDLTTAATSESGTTTANYANWTLATLEVTMNAATDTVQVFLRDRNNNILYVDAFALIEGNLPSDWYSGGYWAGTKYERMYDVTNTPATERRPGTGISAAAATSITDYGEHEAEIKNEHVTDRLSANALAVSYLNAYAVPLVNARLTVKAAQSTDLLGLTGTVKLLNLSGAPGALFPSRINYRIGDDITIDAELGNERPELQSLIRLLAGNISSV